MENPFCRTEFHQNPMSAYCDPDRQPGITRDADEKIGIARIILRLPAYGASVVVSAFCEADRALIVWNQALKLVHSCEYLVVFEDGVSIRGRFLLSSKARTLPSLARMIHTSLGLAPPLRGCTADSVLIDRDGIALGIGALEHYSINKHS